MYKAPTLDRINERDLRTFLREPSTEGPSWARTFGLAALCAVFIIGGFYALNYSSFRRIQDTQAIAASQASPVATPEAINPAPVITTATPTPTPGPTELSLPNNTVSIPDLHISAPVNWNTPFDNTVVLQKLQTGVVNLAGTAEPGEHGMVIITGHSSNYPWAKGSYNDVFAPIIKLTNGQEIDVEYNNQSYIYKVDKSYVVHPDQLEVLQAGSFDGLRLITCTPVGTSTNRLVVEAEQVSPNPATNTAFTQSVFSGTTIPSGQ